MAPISLLLIQLVNTGTVDGINPVNAVILFVTFGIAVIVSPSLNLSPGTAKHSDKSTQGSRSKGAKGTNREQGQVKWFNVSKGYGFVTRQSGEDVFVHFRSIRGEGRRSLREGQDVEFSVVDGDKGPQAEDVEPLSRN